MLRKYLDQCLALLLDTMGGGSGGGQGTGAGSGGGTGSGSGQPGGAGAGSGAGTGAGAGAGTGGAGGGSAPFEFSDTAQLRLSDGRVVTGAQYRQELEQTIGRDYSGRYQRGYDLLLAEAKRLDGLSRSGPRQPQPPQPQDDPFADIWNAPVIDGAAAKRLVTALQQAGLAPLAQQVAALAQELKATKTQLGEVGKRFGSQDEDQESQRFESTLDTVLSKLEVKGLNGKIDATSEPIRQYARNLYLSYVPSSWKAGEFEQQLSREFSDLIAAVREMDRDHVTEARTKLRKNFNPERGATSPGGGGKYKYQSPRELAAMAREAGMFGGSTT
jgi:hypothetical protein